MIRAKHKRRTKNGNNNLIKSMHNLENREKEF
jgi:hypothetical protein